jgi:uncharacterized protein GlcG (DUF336 family)
MLKFMLRNLAMAALLAQPALAQVQNGAPALPLALAIEAAQAAIAACEAQGWPVSASVVDTSGVLRLQAKGDHSTIHTETSSFRKAYTVVTLGPVFRFDSSGDFAKLVAGNPSGPALTSLPHVIALPGAVAIKRGGEIVAALGIGGAPGGDKDEACARAGLARIADRL